MGNRKHAGARTRGSVLAAIIAIGVGAVTAGCHSGGRPVGWHAVGVRVAELSMPLGTGADGDFRTVELRLRGSEDGPSPLRFEERVLLVRDDNVQYQCVSGYAERTYPDGRTTRFRLSGCMSPNATARAGGPVVLKGVRYVVSEAGTILYGTVADFEMKIERDTWAVEVQGGGPVRRTPDSDAPTDRAGWWSGPFIDLTRREARA